MSVFAYYIVHVCVCVCVLVFVCKLYRVMCTGPQLLAMWKDDSPADPTDTCYANVTERRSMILEVCVCVCADLVCADVV